ncbi:MAG: phosphatidate cytidylyltransferase [Pelagimonas sp.]|jgi:phosphatidate cytidylyltransferase|nr:phosphatidate cytidylyltransferase [Pelagimonas sp.]
MSQNWSDLRQRILSALVLIAIGVAAIAASHLAFAGLLMVATLIGVWELVSMGRSGAASGGLSQSDRIALAGYAVLFALGVFGLLEISDDFGRAGLIFIIALVAVTDTLGYFTGRSLGGPKFWPSISPKKTWSGILGGWIGAGLLAAASHDALIHRHGPDFLPFIVIAVALSFASQLGDIAQSAVKRRMGVKDSSNIIPGHGGVLDRFDGLLAVGALFWLLDTCFGG